ncbi:hypothetical protein SK128_003368, partial [Halocaridina rubra]
MEVWKENFKALQTLESSVNIAGAVNQLEVSHPSGYSKAIANFISSSKNSSSTNVENKKVIEEILGSESYSSGKGIKFIHLVHPDNNIRIAAAENFSRMISKNMDMDGKLVELSLSYMLADDCPAVVEKALQLQKGIEILHTKTVIEDCKKLLKKCDSQGKEWNNVKRLVVKVLSVHLCGRYNAEQLQDIMYVFLPYIICPKMNSDMNVAKIILNSPVAKDIPLLNAISCEVHVHLVDNKMKKAEYSSKIWHVLPKVMSDLPLREKECLWETVNYQLKQDVSLISQFISLILVCSGLKDGNMPRNLRLKVAHIVMDYSLMSLDHLE